MEETTHEIPVSETLDMALTASGCEHAHVKDRPRLLSDNGPGYIASELANYISDKKMDHVRGAPFHPQTQGKIERWHQTLKNRVLLENYFLPGDLEAQIEAFVEHYNHQRYHESLDNVTPADAYFGRAAAIIKRRERIKRQNLSKLSRLHTYRSRSPLDQSVCQQGILNWPKFVVHAVIGILLANLAYKHLILPNRSLLPVLESAGNEVWHAIFAFLYAIMNKVPLPEGPAAKRKNRFVRRKYNEIRSKHGSLIDPLLGSADALRLLTYSILIMEDYARPKTVRWLERKIPWKKQLSTGMMQVTAEERLTDEESIKIGIVRLWEVWLSTAEKELNGWQHMVEVILSHNRIEEYLDKVLDIPGLIAIRVDTQFEKAMGE